MNDSGVIDQFLQVFSRYIDSGFGLVRGDVASLAQILVGIDVTLAALFWAWSPGEELLVRLVRKTLYVGFFAFLLSNFHSLAQIVFDSFAGLGLKASGSGLTAADLLRPGHVAAAGVDAIRPLLEAAGELAGFPAVFENLVQIVVLLAAVLAVLAAFFILAVQLFVTILEFKLVTLAGFVLVPFGLFGRTAFLAERVLGNVVASGVKLLVLAVVVAIGSTLFAGFAPDLGGDQPTLDQALAAALGALSLLGLGVCAPNVASGLVSGAPQLSAGSAVGATALVGGLGVAGAGGAGLAAGAGAAALRGTRTLISRARRVPPPHGGGPAGPGPGSSDGGPMGSGPRDPGPSDPDPAAADPSGASARAEAGEAAREAEPPAWARRLLARRGAVAGGLRTAGRALAAARSHGGLAASLEQETP